MYGVDNVSTELYINNSINNNDIWEFDLDYANSNNVASFFVSDGNIHSYPAKAVPEMVHDLLYRLKEHYNVASVLDPFVGSGTVALESKILGLDFYGSDLNPLAVLLAKTKSLTIKNSIYVKRVLENFCEDLKKPIPKGFIYKIEKFKNIEYWFKNENIEQLSYIKYKIDTFLKKRTSKYKEVFGLVILTAFSTTIRESSLTRNDEFKLYRMTPANISKFNINSISVFISSIKKLLSMIQESNDVFNEDVKVEIYLNNAKDLSFMGNTKVDVVLTSPPYGDSRSTVAYGQFSRLSLQWMNDLLSKCLKIDVLVEDCDEYLLGGKYSDLFIPIEEQKRIISSSPTLQKLVVDMENVTEKQSADIMVMRNNFNKFKSVLLKNDRIDTEILFNDRQLSSLIKEKIRLFILRQINRSAVLSSKKKIKKIVDNEVEKFINDLAGDDKKKIYKRMQILKKLLPTIQQSISRKTLHLPRRKDEIIKFFLELYKVVEQTDNVITDNGIQAWIVGHRTVLGKLQVKMADILLEWFRSFGYTEIKLLKRKYHFKRLPHHINSTITRNKEIKTMIEEHIVIVQKTKYDIV